MRDEAEEPGRPNRTLVAVLVSDAALAERIADALTDAPDLALLTADAASADEAEVVVSDGTIATVRPTILLAGDFASDAVADIRATLPISADAALLRSAIKVVAAGYTLVAGRGAFDLNGEIDHSIEGARLPAVALTPRESEVLNLLAQGASNKVIARRLGISVHTAKYHVASLLIKLGAQNRSDAVAIGIRQGLVFI